jgi:hypothetical protein
MTPLPDMGESRSEKRTGVRSISARSMPPTSTPRRWATALTAAVAVAALVIAPAWLLAGGEGGKAGTDSTPVASGPIERTHVLLDAEGWQIDHVSGAERLTEVVFVQGSRSLEVSLRPAASHADYVEDRSLIDSPHVDEGEPVSLLGARARMWPYSDRDHTAIGDVDGPVFPEARGEGMDKTAFVALLADLEWADLATFNAALPPGLSGNTAVELNDAVLAHVDHLPLPPNWEYVRPDGPGDYQVLVSAVGSVACGWLDEWTEADQAGDEARRRAAVDAMAATGRWAERRMKAEGDYGAVVQSYADDIAAGRAPEGYVEGLGCPTGR